MTTQQFKKLIENQLSQFGLNPFEWTVSAISAAALEFSNRQDPDLKLKGLHRKGVLTQLHWMEV